MRYHVAVLMLLLLLVVLPVIDVLAVPAPDPSAILAIGPSPDPKVTDEEYRKGQREAQTDITVFQRVLRDPDVKRLPLIARMKDPSVWLARNLRVTEEDKGRHIRFTFRAGTRAEQVSILNAFLRVNLAVRDDSIKTSEEWLRIHEKNLIEAEQRLKADEYPKQLAKSIDYARTKLITETREILARLKQTTVIKWAK